VEGEDVIGVDLDPTRRPGTPMHAPASGPKGNAPSGDPVEQHGIETRVHRRGLERPTPVFGTAQPLHGVSGLVRRAAYDIPEHRARHWMLLMAADRVDVLEDRLGAVLARPIAAIGARAAADRVGRNPLPYVAGAVAGILVTRRIVG
jgi:hypothetical protein